MQLIGGEVVAVLSPEEKCLWRTISVLKWHSDGFTVSVTRSASGKSSHSYHIYESYDNYERL